MDRIAIFFAANYFAQGMGGLVYEPLSYHLKDRLRLSAGDSALFVAWMTFPFLIKPLFGILTDMIPIRGLRRKPHIILASLGAAASWLTLAARPAGGYGFLLTLLILVNIGGAAADVICDAVMVERGKEREKTGLYQSVQIGTLYATLVVTGLGGGWLTSHAPLRWIFALAALFPLMIACSSVWVDEAPRDLLPGRGAGLLELLSQRRFWALSVFIFLWSFSPFLGTAQFYFESDVLKLSPVFIGFLGTLGGVAGVLGAAVYGRVVGKLWTTRTLVKGAVFIGFPLSLLYALFLGPVSVAVLTFLLGATGVFFRLALMDLAAKSCPAAAEATAFAAYMSVFNLSAWASNTVGGKLYDSLTTSLASAHRSVLVLTAIGALCTLACWGLLPLLDQGTTRRAPR